MGTGISRCPFFLSCGAFVGSVEIKWGKNHYVDKNPNPHLEEDNGFLRLP